MIVRDPNRGHGTPTLRGRRLSVQNIVMGACYEGIDEYAAVFEVSMPDMVDAFEYCAALRCNESNPGQGYCYGCILETFQDDSREEFSEKYVLLQGMVHVEGADGGLKGSYDEEAPGDPDPKYAGWLIARAMLKRMQREG